MGLLTSDYDVATLSLALALQGRPMSAADALSGVSYGVLSHPPFPAANALAGIGLLGRPFGAMESSPAVDQLLAWARPERRVFTSFQMEDHWAIEALRRIKAKPDYALTFYDESISVPFDSVNADYIKRRLRARIARTSVTVCLVGETTYKSKWVSFELFESLKKGNRVIGMGLPFGPKELVRPRFFTQTGAPVKAWDLDWLGREIASAAAPVPFE